MPITLRQPGEATSTARAGSLVGKAERAKEDRARIEREQVRADVEAAQKKSRQAAMAWELQKVQINNQLALEKEMRGAQYQLAAEDRAADRAIERIETAKDLDFQYKTQERQRKQGVIDAERAAWEKEIKSGRVREDELGYRNAQSELDARERALQLDQPFVDPVAAQQRAGRYEMAQESAGRAEEAHEARMAAGIKTDEKLRRERVITVLGSAYREVPLEEAEAEMRELGLMPQGDQVGGGPNDVSVQPFRDLDTVTAQAILQEAGGNRDRARQIAKSRGYRF